LTSCFAEVISVERVKTYKPSPRVYALAPEILKVPREDILFISSNSWDVAGAKAFGFRVCWCNRSQGNMEQLGFAPDLIVSHLGEIAASLR
jgi:2-haloacid dehalogenase